MPTADLLRIGAFDPPVSRAVIERVALRNRSPFARELLARGASLDRLSYREVIELLQQRGKRASLAWPWIASLARLLAYQDLEPQDMRTAAMLLGALPASERTPELASLHARILLALGDRDAARAVAQRAGLGEKQDPFLHLNLTNPWLAERGTGDVRAWSRRLSNALATTGMRGVQLLPLDEAVPFDRLSAKTSRVATGPLVSVVITTYRPRPALLSSVRSIVNQTWQDLEILLVDDGSGPEATEVLAAAQDLDQRVRLIRLQHNGGTYAARDAALAEARGTFITGHDDDDWAHPERIQRQMEPLLEKTAPVGTLSNAVAASEWLEISPLGRDAVGRAAISYLAPVDVLRLSGGYLAARKAADTDLIRRIDSVAPIPSLQLEAALTAYRIRDTSLSRDEFRPGWDHPARVVLWQLSRDVHERLADGSVTRADAPHLVAVPERFAIAPARKHYDLVVAADWRCATPAALTPLLAEVEAFRELGLRVAVLQVEDLTRAGERLRHLDATLLRALNNRTVDMVFMDDDARVDTVLVRHAGTLAAPPAEPARLRPARVLVAVSGRLHDTSHRSTIHGVAHYAEAAHHVFGVVPTVVAEDLVCRQALRASHSEAPARVADWTFPGAIPRRVLTRPRPRSIVGTPVVGIVGWRPDDWPQPDLISGILGHHTVQARTYGAPPPHDVERALSSGRHVHLDPTEVDAVDYLMQVDVFCHFPRRGEAREWVNMALAAGCVVLTAPGNRARYGDSVIPTAASHVGSALRRLVDEPDAYAEQVHRARRYASAELCTPRIGELFNLTAARPTAAAAGRSSRGASRVGVPQGGRSPSAAQ